MGVTMDKDSSFNGLDAVTSRDIENVTPNKRERRSPEERAARAAEQALRVRELAERRAVRDRETSDRAWGRYTDELARIGDRERARQLQEDGLDWMEGRTTEGALRFSDMIDGLRSAVKASRVEPKPPLAKMLRHVRKAERLGGDGAEHGGTGFTVLKLRQKPIPKLVDEGKLGPEGFTAAMEIEQAFTAIASRLMLRGASLDRVDGSRSSDSPMPAALVRTIARYQNWANYWSRRNKAVDDPMFEAVIAAVIDERPIRTIAAQIGRRRETVERAIVAGLQDYAARAHIVTGRMADAWMAEAERIFVPTNSILTEAVRRAKIEV